MLEPDGNSRVICSSKLRRDRMLVVLAGLDPPWRGAGAPLPGISPAQRLQHAGL